MSQKFSGKVVLITGAASGIGAATALHFSTFEGISLSLVDINREELEKIGEKCCQNNLKQLLIQANLANEADVQQIISKTIDKFGQIDILINNAGIYDRGSYETASVKQFDKIFAVNSRAVFQLSLLAIPYLIQTKGNIINMSSIAARKVIPAGLVYSLSKGFIDDLTRNLALSLAPKGVRVNSVNPAATATNLLKNAGMSEEEIKEFLEATGKHPLGRNGRPEDIVKAIVFLAGDDAQHITGVNLAVDGGRHLNSGV